MNIRKEIGRVKGFDCVKGWGFIESNAASEDVFVHYSDIAMNGYKKLRAGDYVLFSIAETDKGFAARGVITLTPDEAFSFLKILKASTLLEAFESAIIEG